MAGFLRTGLGAGLGLLLLFGMVPPADTIRAAASGSAVPAAEEGDGRVFLLSVPQLSFLELSQETFADLPHLRGMIRDGAVGALNIRTPERGEEDVYMSMGAGAPAISRYDVPALERGETWRGTAAERLYARYTGDSGANNAAILVAEGPRMRQFNEESVYSSVPGLLGSLLQENGVGRYVFGSTDAGKAALDSSGTAAYNRHAALMLMDKQGLVPHGAIGGRLLRDAPDRPYGTAVDYAALKAVLADVPDRSAALAELGDLARLHAERGRYAEDRFQALRRDILRETDAFIGEIRGMLRPQDRLIVFSPRVNDEAASRKQFLAPIIIYQPGMREALIHSATTRQPGILSMVDLAPYILDVFGIAAPAEMIGRVPELVPKDRAAEWLLREVGRIASVYQLRLNVLYPFVTYQVIVLLAALIAAVIGRMPGSRVFKTALLSILAAPAVMVGLGYVSGPVWFMALLFIAVWMLATWGLSRLSTVDALGVAGALNAGVILLDGMLGSPAMARSIIGYDPMIGARYYGIGNELMGVLIGAVLLTLSGLLHRFGRGERPAGVWKAGCAVVFAVIVVYLAAPNLGTNAGGAISAIAAFGIAWLRFFVWKPEMQTDLLKLPLVVAGLGVLSLLVLWLLNTLLPWTVDQESHIGRAMRWVAEGRLDLVGAMALRKLEMNRHLIGVSAWSKVLLASLLVIAGMVLRPRGVLLAWQRRLPHFMHGFSAGAVGAIAALLVNDSGIVACATLMLFIAVPMLLLKLDAASLNAAA
jgi:hypothetical protein